jgi:exodeoxyribonuclease V beta subunit
VVTSYTRLRGQRAAARPLWIESAEDRRAEKAEGDVDAGPTTLRAARASGVFLHELLERVPASSFADPGGLAAWKARADVGVLFDEAMTAYRIDPEQRAHAERLVWSAYATPVVLPAGDRLDGFAFASSLSREMDFVYPIPEEAHPSLEGADPIGRLHIEKGYVRGSLDLVFEHRGLTYFLDWKSDSLGSYGPEALSSHVAAHYADQARLYALAVVRLLGIRSRADHDARFGGLLYCFLRGFDGELGLWSSRPDWETILAWDRSLRARPWGAR